MVLSRFSGAYSITVVTGGCPRNWTSVTLMSLLNLLSPDWVW